MKRRAFFGRLAGAFASTVVPLPWPARTTPIAAVVKPEILGFAAQEVIGLSYVRARIREQGFARQILNFEPVDT